MVAARRTDWARPTDTVDVIWVDVNQNQNRQTARLTVILMKANSSRTNALSEAK